LEAISRKKEVDEMKTMAKEFNFLTVTKAGPLYTLTDGQGWRQPNPAFSQFVSSTYFDLGGLTIDDKTLFFEGATIQEVLPPSASNATAGDGVVVVDIMSVVPLTDTEVLAYSSKANFAESAGSTLAFEQTVYGRVRVFNIDIDNAAGGYYITLSDNQTGSLSATASDRIYCYRAALFGANNSDGDHSIYGARYLLRAHAKEEAEYEYLMRLKRSYELQNEPDRD
jgi:hypothetical protein